MRSTCLAALFMLTFTSLLSAGEKEQPKKADQAEAKVPTLCDTEIKNGFVALFDGKTLKGWQGSVNGYEAKDGVLAVKQKGGGNLFTDKEYSNFIFRFEFKVPPGGNNGIGIRSPLKGNPAYSSMEIQVLDDSSPRYAKLQPGQYHGSIYQTVAAKRGHQKPVGQWNTEEIKADDGQITVTLNGVVITDADVFKLADKLKRPNLKRTSGHIGFLGHGAGVEFRNIRIKELKPTGDTPKE